MALKYKGDLAMVRGPHLGPKFSKSEGKSFKLSDLWWLFTKVKDYRKEYLGIVFFLTLQISSYQLLSLSLKYLINDIIPFAILFPPALKFIFIYLASWVVAFAIHSAFTLAGAKITIFFIKDLVAEVRRMIIEKLQRLSIRYFDDKGSGKTSMKILNDMDKLQQLLMWSSAILLNGLITIFITLPLLGSINTVLTIITFIFVPAIMLIQLFFRKRLYSQAMILRDNNESLSEKIVEFISGIRQIRLFASEDERSRVILEQVENVRNSDIRFMFSMRVMRMLAQFFADISPVLLWVVAGVIMINDSSLRIGSVVAYVAMTHVLTGSFNSIFQGFDQIVAAAPSIGAIMRLIHEDDEEKNDGKLKDFTIDGSLTFDNVSFSYTERGQEEQLKNVNVDIRPGEKVAIVGESGAGKSTFIDIALGFYIQQKGEVRYGNYSTQDINLKELRSQIAVMTQETFLFNASIYENVLFAKQGANEEEVVEAYKKAEIYNFIENLSQGDKTVVGERGVQLSGGERQRMGLARLFLLDPKIIILDEPSSSLDVFTEQKFIKTLYKHVEGKTLIIIAHRLSTIRQVDKILVFDKGTIVECGSFDELNSIKDGYFAKMVRENQLSNSV